MSNSAVRRLFADVAKSFVPPPVMSYSEWATDHFQMWGSGGDGSPFRPWKFQRGILDAIGDPVIERVSVIKSARTGYALALDTPIPTASGWKTMGTVAEGDTLFDENGNTCAVTFKSEVFHDHECYRVTFDDGEQIVADAAHRWRVHSVLSFEKMLEGRNVRGSGASCTREGVLTTEQIAAHWRLEKRNNFAIDVAKPLSLPDTSLPIPPYTLGLWLGDGYSRCAYVLQHRMDVETADYVRNEGVECTVEARDPRYPNNCTLVLGRLPSGRTFRQAMKDIGIYCEDLGSSTKKHIPQQYLRASMEQRLELLRGLMDSDGHADKRGRAEFSCTSRALSEGVAELAASLGYKATLIERPMSGLMKYPQYRVAFLAEADRNPFRLVRKADRVRLSAKPTVTRRRKIVNVEKVSSVPTQCISVSSPSHLFLAGKGMVPTHNTVSLVAAIAAIAANDPGPIMLLMPTDDDARGIAVDEIDPAFRNNPHLKGLLVTGRFDGRNTLTQRSLAGGGSLKINSARSPNNLRRHTVRTLYCDEVDGMKPTAEGDPLVLAEKRTLSKADRKIVYGSTPTDEATSIISKKYLESDQRIFEVPCEACGQYFEMLWENLSWKRGDPESVRCICPHCKEPLEEKYKPKMVEDGDWRATRPHVKGHAGFRLNALISQFANASWPKLVEEYEKAEKNGATEMQGFQNTVLGRVWSAAIDHVNENQLMARREQFGLVWDHARNAWREDIPEDVAYITAGVDVQPDRLEILLLGWSRNHRYTLGHIVIRGSALLQTTWDELDALLSTVWKHPLGGEIGIEAACVDSGYLSQKVYDYCEVVQGRKIVAIKGDDGPRPILKASKTKRRNRTATLYILGVDQVKTDILVSLPLGNGDQNSIRFSNTLEEEFFLQLTAERREIKLKNGKPEPAFVRIQNRKAEALDTMVYAIAAKQLCRFDYDNRYDQLRSAGKPKRPSLKELAAKLNR